MGQALGGFATKHLVQPRAGLSALAKSTLACPAPPLGEPVPVPPASDTRFYVSSYPLRAASESCFPPSSARELVRSVAGLQPEGCATGPVSP